MTTTVTSQSRYPPPLSRLASRRQTAMTFLRPPDLLPRISVNRFIGPPTVHVGRRRRFFVVARRACLLVENHNRWSLSTAVSSTLPLPGLSPRPTSDHQDTSSTRRCASDSSTTLVPLVIPRIVVSGMCAAPTFSSAHLLLSLDGAALQRILPYTKCPSQCGTVVSDHLVVCVYSIKRWQIYRATLLRILVCAILSRDSVCLSVHHTRQKAEHTGWPIKSKPQTSVHVFVKYWPIFKIFPLAHSVENL